MEGQQHQQLLVVLQEMRLHTFGYEAAFREHGFADPRRFAEMSDDHLSQLALQVFGKKVGHAARFRKWVRDEVTKHAL